MRADIEPNAVEMLDALHTVMCGVNAQLFRVFGDKVLSGPFQGMIIPEHAPWNDDNSGTKLIGTYEQELHDAIRKAISRDFKVLVNVGCGEGFYAIGLARLVTTASVYAFDISQESLEMCSRFSKLNCVSDRINVREGCHSPERMIVDERGNRLYIIDCEGDERKLIDLQKCPDLIDSDIIVECHDFLVPGVGMELAKRLDATHEIEFIRAKMPDLRQYEFLSQFPSILVALAAVEKRPMPCYWLACWANSKGLSNG